MKLNMDVEGGMDGPGFLDPIPEDVSVVAASQHAVNLSTVSAVASSDSGGMVESSAKRPTKKRRGRKRRGKETGMMEPTEGGAGIEDNVSDVNASLCGANGLEGSALKKGQLSKVDEETSKSAFLSPSCKKWSRIFFAILAVLAVSIGVGMYFMVVRVPEQSIQESSSPSLTPKPPEFVYTYSTGSPTSSPVYSPEEIKKLEYAIEKVFGTSRGNMYDMNTPEGKGLDWLIHYDRGILLDEEKRVQQRYILSVFYFATNGDVWKTKWLDPERSECEWLGVTCNATNGVVERIDIGDNNITGTIPNEIQSLSDLIYLNVSYNNISGTIPLNFFNSLIDLEWLDMQQNQLTGKIPERSVSISKSRLRMIDLGSNQFTGVFPFFKNVESVRFGMNNLTSIDPLYMTDSQSLKELRGFHNQLIGTLPTAWRSNHTLIELDLGYNFWTGTIPQDLWNLPSLKSLWLDHCNLTGPLPSLSESTSMHRLWLDSNQLSGTIPSGFGWNWTKLYSVKLQDNQLTGSVTLEQCNRWKQSEGLWTFNIDCQIECACCTNENCSLVTPANIDGR